MSEHLFFCFSFSVTMSSLVFICLFFFSLEFIGSLIVCFKNWELPGVKVLIMKVVLQIKLFCINVLQNSSHCNPQWLNSALC